MNATQDFSNSSPPLLIVLLAYASLLLGATLLSRIIPGPFIGPTPAKWACSLQNLAPTSYWIVSLTSQLVRLGLLPGELSPITHMLTLSKLSVLWTFGLSLGGLALLALVLAGSIRVCRFCTFNLPSVLVLYSTILLSLYAYPSKLFQSVLSVKIILKKVPVLRKFKPYFQYWVLKNIIPVPGTEPNLHCTLVLKG